MRNPALILCPPLMRAVNAAHPQHSGVQTKGSRVVKHILIRSALRTTVWRAKVEGLIFGNAISPDFRVLWCICIAEMFKRKFREVTVDFVGARVNDRYGRI